MRFLIDTNILLHAVNPGSPAHSPAHRFLQEHLRLRSPWCITWPILYEFLRVSTHSRVFPKPLKPGQALEFITNLASREEVAILTETDRHMAVLEGIVGGLSHPGGNLFHDIHTAALMREHGVPEIVSADTDFLQFSFLKVTNPLLKKA
jgi:toxin-antitoxin system PIN domain toxin